ncbi:S-layer homology domain-containing protein [Paenibacillus sp. strain BS8-2]
MTLRRKLAVTTIAASVAMSAFAGIPLSSKGLSEKLGFSGVAYAATYSDFVAEANAIYSYLDTDEVGYINNFRVQIKAALEADDSAILDQFVAGINDGELADEVKALITAVLTTVVGPTWQSDYEDIRDLYSPTVSELYPDLTVDALASVLLDMEARTAAIVADLDLEDILDTSSIKQQLKNAATAAISANTIVSDFAESIELTSTELADIFVAIQDSDSVDYLVAARAFIALNDAYKQAHAPIGGGGGYIPPATTDIPAEVTALVEKFEALAEELANATDEEKAELIAQAIEEAQALIDDLSDLDSSVIVNGDTATLKLDENKALSAIKGIGAVVAALEEATGETLDSLDVTIDLGNVTQDNLVIGLSDAVMQEAIHAGLTGIILKVSGLTVDLPVGGTFSKAIDLKISKSDATDEVTGGLKAASDVFEFNLSVGGQTTTTFSKPIQIIFPLGDTTGLDKELLTLAKIIEDKLEFHGGRVKGNTITEARDSFSSYVVVENKLSFDDTESVDAWAGRAIEVIASKGVIHGVTEGHFDPASKVTRAQFAKMLVRALDLNNQAAKEKFVDVKDDEWFAPYIAAAYENGLINGRSATIFDPYAEISRAEMATMVARGLKLTSGAEDIENVDEALKVFADWAEVNDTLKQGVAFAAEHSIVVGNEGKYDPNASATRAQAAVIIYRAYNFEA